LATGATGGGDILDRELRHGRITLGAHSTGRALQALWEQTSRIGGVAAYLGQSDRVDGTSRKGDIMGRSLDNLRRARAVAEKMERVIGREDARFVREVLCGAATFAEYARARGRRTSERQVRAVAQHWRMLMEILADAFGGKGHRTGQIVSFRKGEK
jgi:hypothetical protein